tara:strand:- start:3 stop:752 length:750 start_codon:yes stop_codon:yes gene_type:complete
VRFLVYALSCLFLASPLPLRAELASLLGGEAFQSARTSILQKPERGSTTQTTPRKGSLFTSQGGLGLFAPYPGRPALGENQAGAALAPYPTSTAAHIRNIISQAEAGSKGYDAVQYGALKLPRKQPTQMTIAEIYRWIDQTPGQPHAIGRYQFIPATLRRLVSQLALSPNETFDARTQDRLADILLAEAGLAAATRGDMTRQDFMNNLAKIWAGLPNSTGRSEYDGYAGNRATMTWARFSSEMEKVFPS